jgi:hypothetical protein
MFRLLLKLLQLLGRRYIVHTDTGIIISDKYMLFKPGVHMYDGSNFWKKLPDVHIHIWQHNEGLKEFPHHHGRNSYSFILSGGYLEKINGVANERRRFSFGFLKYDTPHDISNILPGTVTIFVIGFFKKMKIDTSQRLILTKYNEESLNKINRKRKAYLKLIRNKNDL